MAESLSIRPNIVVAQDELFLNFDNISLTIRTKNNTISVSAGLASNRIFISLVRIYQIILPNQAHIYRVVANWQHSSRGSGTFIASLLYLVY